jgi:PAS domain S-box-containing protein
MDLNKLLKLSVDLICTVNANDQFVKVSEASYAILGYHPNEMCGKSYHDFILPSELMVAEQAVATLITGGPDTEIQVRYLHKDGRVIPLLWCVNWDAEDQLMYCIARSGRITEQTELMRASLEESHRRYQYVTKATSDAIWDWDIINGTLYWGEGFKLIFGYNQMEGQKDIYSWTKNIHQEDSAFVLNSIDRLCKSNETNWKEEYRYLKANGTYAHVVDRGFVIRDQKGKAVRMVGAMHDISERKKALLETKQVTSDLFKRNQELHEFGYIVSHGLRAPVANIRGLAMLLQTEKNVPEQLRPYLTNLVHSVSTLDEVVFDLSRILSATNRSIELQSEVLDLQDIIVTVKADLNEKIAHSDTQITITGGPFFVTAHKKYIYIIFFKLIANSIKYKQEHPPIIGIHIEQLNKHVIITYQDNGCGIDLEKYGEDIFRPYKQFHPTIKGKGLGLFLVKSYIEALEGTINIQSKVKQGITYTITIPQY